MTAGQKAIKVAVKGFAILLCVLIIAGIVSAIASLFEEDTLKEPKDYTPAEALPTGSKARLELNIGAAELVLTYGSAFHVESNLKHLTVEIRGETLRIRQNKRVGGSNVGEIRVVLPYETSFHEILLKIGAGKVTADELSSHRFRLDLGAGNTVIRTLHVTGDADFQVGAGNLNVGGGEIANLDMEVGAGNTDLTARLTGTCDLEMGVGNSRIVLLGAREDYTLSVEKGLGSLTVDGEAYAETTLGTGKNQVDVEGGVGKICIEFEDTDHSS